MTGRRSDQMTKLKGLITGSVPRLDTGGQRTEGSAGDSFFTALKGQLMQSRNPH